VLHARRRRALHGTTSQPVTATTDPDPTTPTLTSGVGTTGTTAATSGTWNYYKIQVPAGKSQLKVTLAGPSCGLLGCSPDLDLYVKAAAKPTTASYDGSSATGSNSETVTITSPSAAWYYVGVYVYSGSSSVSFTVTATVS
jgi:serine protease